MINYDFYGQPSTWLAYGGATTLPYITYTSDPAGGQYVAISRGSLSDLYRMGRLAITELPDLSVCYAGMAVTADLAKYTYYTPDGIHSQSKAAGAIPFFIGQYGRLNSTSTCDPTFNPDVYTGSWGGEQEPTIVRDAVANGDAGIAPIVKLHGRSFVLLICVTAAIPSDDGYTNLIHTSLKDWYDNYSTTHTMIIRIYASPMIAAAVSLRSSYNAPRWSTGVEYGSVGPVLCSRVDDIHFALSRAIMQYPNTKGFVLSGSAGIGINQQSAAPSITLSSIYPVYGDMWHIVKPADTTRWYPYAYIIIGEDLADADALLEYAYTQAAYLGMFFTADSNLALRVDDDVYTDPDMLLGIIDDDGITRGYYTRGTENATLPQYSSSDLIADSKYDPAKPVDPNRYDEKTLLNRSSGTTGFSALPHYGITSADLYNLKKYLYLVAPNLLDPDTGSDYEKYFLNQNPIDLIVSVVSFPLDLTPYLGAAVTLTIGNQPVMAPPPGGGAPVAVTAQPFVDVYGSSGFSGGTLILDAGYCTYYPHFGDFRDYEGSADLLIPYCGSVHIEPQEYMGHQISVKYLMDLSTGSCLALVYRDTMVMDTIAGQVGVPVPLSGIQQADYITALHNARHQLIQTDMSNLIGMAGGLAAAAGGALTGSPMVAAGGLMAAGRSIASAASSDKEWQLDHVKAPVRTVGTAAAATSMVNEQYCRLIIRRPKMLSYDPDAYGHSVGYACYRVGPISAYSGYTQIINADLSGIPATDEELQMIRSAMASGIYL